MSIINGAANRWRQWGFTQRTTSVPTNPAPHITRNTQATTANQQTEDLNQTPGNHNPQEESDNANPTPAQATGAPQTQSQQQAQYEPNNPLTPTQNNNTAEQVPTPSTDNPSDTGQQHDSYLEPWGDQFQQPKPPNTIRICLQNFGGWPTSAKHQKNDNIRRFVNSAEVDVLLTTENNIAWHKLTGKNRITKRTRGWWESLQVNTAHNMTDPHTGAYQPGGVGVFSINRMAHRVHSIGSDPTGLGRYSWTVFYGKDNKRLRAIAAYRPSKSNNGHLSVTQQHWRHLTSQSPAGTTVAHPRTQFWTDLRPLLQAWSDDGEQILIGLDANEKVNTPEITKYFHSLGMTEAILHRHGQDAPPMHQCGSQAIDGIFVTNGLLGHPSGYLSGLAGISGDHCCLWIDLPEQWLFGGNMPVIVRPGARRLKSDDPRTRKRYLDNLEAFFTGHKLLEKTQQVDHDSNSLPLPQNLATELERLDDLRIQGMIQAECQCRKLHTRPYGWTPDLTRMMAEIKYW